jgi:hypothetical protein
MLIYFDVTGPARITQIRIDTEGDGEPGWGWTFDGDTDGRAVRAFSVKPVLNGEWAFSIEAADARGCKVKLIDPTFYKVQVTF